jgi:hypothetical protein
MCPKRRKKYHDMLEREYVGIPCSALDREATEHGRLWQRQQWEISDNLIANAVSWC